MVKPEKYEGKQIHTCEVCGFGYIEKEYAQQCEDHCRKYHGCSLEITRHAVKKFR